MFRGPAEPSAPESRARVQAAVEPRGQNGPSRSGFVAQSGLGTLLGEAANPMLPSYLPFGLTSAAVFRKFSWLQYLLVKSCILAHPVRHAAS